MSTRKTSHPSLPPHGGELCELLVTDDDKLAALKAEAQKLPRLVLTDRQLCDIELLLNGGFSPLRGFMTEAEHKGCVEEMKLPSGLVWPMPICLDVTQARVDELSIKEGARLTLQDDFRNAIAVITVTSVYTPDRAREAEMVLGSRDDVCHPGIAYLLNQTKEVYVGGTLEGIRLPVHFDYQELRMTPREVRERIAKFNWHRIVALQTRNPMHRSHRELTLLAARDLKANVLVQPVVGMTKPGDVDHYTRVRCYLEIMKHYPKGMAELALLPLAMRMGGPREAIWHALIRKNYGATHFIIGRDHAGPGNNREGKSFYDPYAAQELAKKLQPELGIQLQTYQAVVYVEDLGDYQTIDKVPEGMRVLNISGTELRRRLFKGIDIPEWFSFPAVIKILRETYPPKKKQGFTVFFTGLSSSGKSTIASALMVLLLQDGRRPVTMLDGDEVRKHLSTELTFSKEHRDLNIRRVGYVASTITKSRGVAVVANIAPYDDAREAVREMCSKQGGFVLVHVATPVEVCEARDESGLYAKARSGEIENFTGVSDPFEAPKNAEITVDTSEMSVQECVHEIMLHLQSEGYLEQE